MIHRALSLWQPWAWLMVHGHKMIENRPRRLSYRGPLLIHAAAQLKHENYLKCLAFCEGIGFDTRRIPRFEDFFESACDDATARHVGGFVGITEMVDCVTEAFGDHQQWFTGPYGYVFDKTRPVPFRPFKGMQGLMKVEIPADWEGYHKLSQLDHLRPEAA